MRPVGTFANYGATLLSISVYNGPMTTTENTSVLAVTMGDPAGIGGEILIKSAALRQERGAVTNRLVALDDPDRLHIISKELGLEISIRTIDEPKEVLELDQHVLGVIPLNDSVPSQHGRPSIETASSVIESIELGVRFAESGDVSGLVTNPINKSVLFEAGFLHPGHTEFLAHLTGIKSPPVMMLAGPSLRVVPVTIHQSLKEALANLTTAKIVETASITADGLKRGFGLERPTLAVAGLNPHAGEDGTMGREEFDIIMPAIEALRIQGLEVFGPVPPDALFTPRARSNYDVAICMYHDQALIPIKALDFDQGVNVTLGLPIIRTSPDHGTAFDIAGQGVADPSSLLAAIDMASEMARCWPKQ